MTVAPGALAAAPAAPGESRRAWAQLQRAEATSGAAAVRRIAIAGSFTVDPVTPYLGLRLHELGEGTAKITIGPFDQLMQTCLDYRGTLGNDANVVVLIWRIEDLLRSELQAFIRGDAAGLDRALDKLMEFTGALAILRNDFSGLIIVSNPGFPHGPDLDIRNLAAAETSGEFHRAIAGAFAAAVRTLEDVILLDLDGLQRLHGVPATLDMRKWYLYRQPFTETYWQSIGNTLASLIASRRVASKKCLVIDCDNTLWGGIIGEDGMGGISIGDDYPGSAFRDFQQLLLTLRSQGVLLAICSKNNESDALDVFDNHPNMVLRREHLAAWRINWQDKPSNIAELALELNIGLDSMVFIDDSSMEIDHVKSALSMVECIQVPADAAQLPMTMAASRLFDRLSVTAEDRARSDMMAQERARREISQKSVSKEDFIRSLALHIDLAPVDTDTLDRVTQLVNKTNQFNLTTKRRDKTEIGVLMADANWITLAMRVEDRFGDYGLVGVAFIHIAGTVASIETLLMSCRVLGRNVEESFLAAIAAAAAARGAQRLNGMYVASAKNAMVSNFWSDRGFTPTDDGHWTALIATVPPWPEHVGGGLR